MLDIAASFFSEIFFNPLYGEGYQFWSGIGSDIGELTILGALVAIFKQHNCRVKGCWRFKWRDWTDSEGHVHGLCKIHHPHHRHITADYVQKHIERLADATTPRSKDTP